MIAIYGLAEKDTFFRKRQILFTASNSLADLCELVSWFQLNSNISFSFLFNQAINCLRDLIFYLGGFAFIVDLPVSTNMTRTTIVTSTIHE